MVQVEMAGPRLPQTYDIIPNDIRDLAGVVLNECITGPSKIGGFATSDLQVMRGWITAEETNLDRPFRASPLILHLCLSFSLERFQLTADIHNFSSDLHRFPHSKPHQRSP